MTDVTGVNHAIDDLVAQRSRAGLADKVNTLIGTFAENSGTYTAEQAETVDGVIARLVADVSPVDRMAIASRIASDPHAPPGVVARLACDDWIEIASPILTQSPCLSDETLLKVIDSKGHSHLLAISRRRALPADVADRLIERGNRSVVKSLARNPGANLSAEARRSLERRERERFEELRKTPRKAGLSGPTQPPRRQRRPQVPADRRLEDRGEAVARGDGPPVGTAAAELRQCGGQAPLRGGLAGRARHRRPLHLISDTAGDVPVLPAAEAPYGRVRLWRIPASSAA